VDDDTGPSDRNRRKEVKNSGAGVEDRLLDQRTRLTPRAATLAVLVWVTVACVVGTVFGPSVAARVPGEGDTGLAGGSWIVYFPVSTIAFLVFLVSCSAFFSGSEIAFLSIPQIRLRSLNEDKSISGRLIAAMMIHPGRLLTTILIGNLIVNILISVVLGGRAVTLLEEHFELQPALASVLAVAICTTILVFFGEIAPKILAAHLGERFARVAAFPLLLSDKVLSVLREALLYFTDFIFRVTRFTELHAAPFMTDEELKAVLSGSEAKGVIQEEKRQMIQGILEFTDAPLREILVPRPDVIAIPAEATVSEALKTLREHEFARMPVYEGDLDHIVGILFAKDLLPAVTRGGVGTTIGGLVRQAHFVPETMSIHTFVKEAQRLRTHMAVVVDEYGGTEGIVTLEDALEEVVGDIMDEDEEDEALYEQLDDHVYRISGGLALDDLGELIGVNLEDEEHETVAGFVMDQIDKIPEAGDTITYAGVRFVVEAVDGKRVESLRVELVPESAKEGSA